MLKLGGDPPTIHAVIPIIECHRDEIEQLCRCHGVRRLDLFGSAARNEFDPARSDLDFFVEFQETNWRGSSQRFFGLLHGLEDLLQRPIDLVERPAVQNATFLRVAQVDLEPIYDASGSAAQAS
jgi:uncharacterized protein